MGAHLTWPTCHEQINLFGMSLTCVLPKDHAMDGERRADLAERLNWLHCLVQELENGGVELPMGDYTDVYGIIEDARETIGGHKDESGTWWQWTITTEHEGEVVEVTR